MKRSIYFFGWSTIIVSVILILSQFLSIAISNSVDQITGLVDGYPGIKNGALRSMSDMFTYNRIWSVYSIGYFLVTLVGGILFVRFQETGRRTLEIACWVGILNACVDTTASYIFWNDLETAMIGLAGGMGISGSQLNPLGLGTIIVGFLIWIVPSIGIVFYLRRPSLKAQMIQNSGTAGFEGPTRASTR
jgi:hypothetical protein